MALKIPSEGAPPASAPLATSRLTAVTGTTSYDFLVALPEGYQRGSGRRWPLLLFLHGVGERGSNVWDVVRQGPPKLAANPAELSEQERAAADLLSRSFILVAPQCPQHTVWDDRDLLALIDRVSGDFDLDEDRIALTGLSMGGFGAWSLGLRHAERFAALVPVCGGGRIADVTAAKVAQPAALRRLPVWAFHGAKDALVPLEESTRMVDALREAGVPEVRLTVYSECEHDAWTETYANCELYHWLLRQSR